MTKGVLRSALKLTLAKQPGKLKNAIATLEKTSNCLIKASARLQVNYSQNQQSDVVVVLRVVHALFMSPPQPLRLHTTAVAAKSLLQGD